MKLKLNDTVEVIIGKDKGKTGKIEKIMPSANKIVVSGINQYKRHVKGKLQGQKSEIITITKPLPLSNVALICKKCKKKTRVGYTISQGKKIRVCRKCDEQI